MRYCLGWRRAAAPAFRCGQGARAKGRRASGAEVLQCGHLPLALRFARTPLGVFVIFNLHGYHYNFRLRRAAPCPRVLAFRAAAAFIAQTVLERCRVTIGASACEVDVGGLRPVDHRPSRDVETIEYTATKGPRRHRLSRPAAACPYQRFRFLRGRAGGHGRCCAQLRASLRRMSVLDCFEPDLVGTRSHGPRPVSIRGRSPSRRRSTWRADAKNRPLPSARR